MLENSWNLSMKIMFHLPVQTHRYFIEPITEKPHARTLMVKNFLRFCELIVKSNKEALKSVFHIVKKNVQSYTGKNLRKIMVMMKKSSISELKSCEVKESLEYNPVPINQSWRIPFLKEIIDIKAGNLEVEGFTSGEISEIMEHICIS